jgi:cysteine-rich repeat protein
MKKSTLALLGIWAVCIVAGGWYALQNISSTTPDQWLFATQSAKKSYYILFQNQNDLSAFEGRIATTVSKWVNALTLADKENNLFKKHNLPIVQVNETSRNVAQYLAGKSALVEEILPVELFQSQWIYNDPLVDQQWYIEKLWSAWSCGTADKVLWIHDTGVMQHEDLIVNWDSDTQQQYGIRHGTLVAWAAGAQTNNAIGIASMSEWVQMISKNNYWNIDGLLDLRDQGAEVINMSYGLEATECPQTMQWVINYLSNKWVQFVAAAWNNASSANNTFPANCDNVLSVWAIGQNLKKASFSNSADIYAPWVDILTTDNWWYKKASWTSISSAIVAWLVAKWVDVMQHLKTNSQGLSYIDLTECTGNWNNWSWWDIWESCLWDTECLSWVCEEITQGKCVSWQYGEKLACKWFTTEEQCLSFKQEVWSWTWSNSWWWTNAWDDPDSNPVWWNSWSGWNVDPDGNQDSAWNGWWNLVSVCEWEETVVWGTCVASCGNNIVEETEQCDDGNNTNRDWCSSTCKIDWWGSSWWWSSAWSSSWGGSSAWSSTGWWTPTCGNNLIESPEQCDGSGCAKWQTCAPAWSKNACTCQFDIVKNPTPTPPTRDDWKNDR